MDSKMRTTIFRLRLMLAATPASAYWIAALLFSGAVPITTPGVIVCLAIGAVLWLVTLFL